MSVLSLLTVAAGTGIGTGASVSLLVVVAGTDAGEDMTLVDANTGTGAGAGVDLLLIDTDVGLLFAGIVGPGVTLLDAEASRGVMFVDDDTPAAVGLVCEVDAGGICGVVVGLLFADLSAGVPLTVMEAGVAVGLLLPNLSSCTATTDIPAVC